MTRRERSSIDQTVSLIVVALISIIPACLCSYAAGMMWWLLKFGGDDDISFLFEGPYMMAYKISGPTATEVGRMTWPVWWLILWLASSVIAFVVWHMAVQKGKRINSTS